MTDGSYWRALKERQRESAARQVLSAVVALAEQGQRLQDPSFFAEILKLIEVEPAKEKATAAPVLGFGKCQVCGRDDRRLYEVAGVPTCIGCRRKEK